MDINEILLRCSHADSDGILASQDAFKVNNKQLIKDLFRFSDNGNGRMSLRSLRFLYWRL